MQEYSDKWLNYRFGRLQMLWNQIQEVCVKCPLVEVPVTQDGLKNGVGCDKAYDVKIFLKIICNWFHEQVPGLTSAS